MPNLAVIRTFVAAGLVCVAGQPTHADHNLFIIHGPPAIHWTGYYWGGHAGLQWEDVAGESLAEGLSAELEERSWSAGLGIGYDREISTVVFGWTADLDLTPVDIERRLQDVPLSGTEFMADDLLLATELRWLSTFRGRIGFRVDRLLPFGTLGLAVARAESSATGHLRSLTDPTAAPDIISVDGSEWVAGWTGGGGLEYRLTAKDVIGIEYLFVDLPIDDASPLLLRRKTAEDFTSHIVRALFRYRF